ncbi:MAG: carboxypeptidase-like regulatory domain-containing protein [Chitinophagaceae bacterium]
MKKLLLIITTVCIASASQSQIFKSVQTYSDSVVQLYGVVMTADSLRALEDASVIVVGKGRGTITNNQGVFSIAVMKGDQIEFSTVGFKSKTILIPTDLEGKDFSVVQLLVDDTAYLPGTVIRPRPSRAQFERDFINADIPFDQYEIARQNTEESKRRILLSSLPSDGREAVSYSLKQTANKAYYAGQIPPMNIMNPFAWGEFIKAWKRGDFKKKK